MSWAVLGVQGVIPKTFSVHSTPMIWKAQDWDLFKAGGWVLGLCFLVRQSPFKSGRIVAKLNGHRQKCHSSMPTLQFWLGMAMLAISQKLNCSLGKRNVALWKADYPADFVQGQSLLRKSWQRKLFQFTRHTVPLPRVPQSHQPMMKPFPIPRQKLIGNANRLTNVESKN
jgi:hypothetical protein